MTQRPHRIAASLLASAVAAGLCAPGCRRQAPKPSVQAAVPKTPSTEPASATSAGYDFRPAEKVAVEAFLRQNPDLRLAADSDRRPPDGGDEMTSLYGVYHPYFIRGDANDDGILDFVLAFVRRDSERESPWFSVAVFSGRSDGSFSAGTFLERDISLADGDLALDRDAIVVTPDTGDEATRRYRWDPSRQRHVFVRDNTEESDSPPPAQT
jgi:hypothetical protein